MKQFTELGLAEPLLRAITAEGYTRPTPIQAELIPVLLAGRDAVGIAQTGTGKTAAFVLPLLNRLAGDRLPRLPKSCRALILAPTRELAAQIADNIRTYGRHVRPQVAVIVGGTRPGPQIRSLAPGVDILVATPGRLLDHMSSGAVRLEGVSTLILDEADQMLDLGFLPAIRRIVARAPSKRQTVLLSATMPGPIRALANDFLRAPAEISVTPASRPIERIEQKVIHVPHPAKRRVLVEVLRDRAVERAIVFTRTKRGADRVTQHLMKAGIDAAAIHGDKSQGQRERALGAFRSGKTIILVATDIAARGIDVDDVSHVVNYELPNVPEAYVHRIGRTARAGKNGVAVSLCDVGERPYLRDIEKLIGRAIEVSGDIRPAPGDEATPRLPGRQPEKSRHKEQQHKSQQKKKNGQRNAGRGRGRNNPGGSSGGPGRPARAPQSNRRRRAGSGSSAAR